MKDGMSKFLKTAYACNKVKDLYEVFIECPVQDEWHQGNLEHVVEKDEKIEK